MNSLMLQASDLKLSMARNKVKAMICMSDDTSDVITFYHDFCESTGFFKSKEIQDDEVEENYSVYEKLTKP